MSTDTLGRVIQRVPAGTASGSNLLASQRALASVTGHLLTSDLNHLGAEYSRRVLWAHPGFFGFWAGPLGSPTGAGPTVDEIDWRGPGYSVPAGRTANAHCGTHWVVREGATTVYPKLVLRCRARAASSPGSTTGLYLGATPGGAFPTPSNRFDRALVSSTSFVDVKLTVQLEHDDLAPFNATPSAGSTASGVPVVADPVRLLMLGAFFGAYNSTNKNTTTADVTDVVGLTLSLEP